MPAPNHIEPVRRGDSVTLLDTDKANELINAINRLMNIEVRVTSTGSTKFTVSGQNIILTISKSELAA